MSEYAARAEVATTAPARYAKQLAAHLGRKLEVRGDDTATELVFDGGTCRLVPGNASLELLAEAATSDGLERIQQVVGSHLERFGTRNELVVSWQPVSRP